MLYIFYPGRTRGLSGQGTPAGDLINLKYVAGQLLNALVGSFGLVSTAPLTALSAAWVFAGRHLARRAGNF